MAPKKNQHFVPKFLLRFFSENSTQKSIALMLRANGKIICGASIKSQCCGNNFYGEKAVEDLLCEMETDHAVFGQSAQTRDVSLRLRLHKKAALGFRSGTAVPKGQEPIWSFSE